MTSLDFVLFGIIAGFAIIGALRGWIRETLSLAVWVLAGVIAWFFADNAAPLFARDVFDRDGQRILAFIALFVVSFIALTIVSFFVRIALIAQSKSTLDRVLGALFGAGRGLLVTLILVALAGLTRLPRESWWKDSHLAPPLQRLTLTLVSELPANLARQFRY